LTERRFHFPNGKRFAFTVIDDTDVATVENVKPVYDLLERLGMRATKTVWPVGCPEGSANFATSETLEDAHYRDFVRDLQRRGFEITWHGATMESSTRERTLDALERFRDVFGNYPRIHVNHAENRENLYWGAARIDQPVLKRLFARFSGWPADWFAGHVESSPFWWGDASVEHMEYARNLTFNDIDTGAMNPSMPYRDPTRPLVRWWFSATDAEDVDEFNHLVSTRRLDRLERNGGFCVVATHFGKRFVQDGEVQASTRERLERLALRPGWFPTAGELLDWLRSHSAGEFLPPAEWRRMQWLWARDLGARKWRQRRRARRSRNGDRG